MDAEQYAVEAANAITGGLFDIAEIYDRQGRQLAEGLTRDGETVEKLLPGHRTPTYIAACYESLKLPDQRWVMRIFVSLRESADATEITGYFEGVRIVPEWQREQMLANALTAALMIGLASLLCGAAIYPVVVTGIGWLDGASAVVAGHHEKWNGSGYPRRLKGEQILLAARIFAVADVFDALCSKRPYKEAMGFDAAMTILEMDTGSHCDPGVMAAFRSIARQVFERLSGCSEDEARCLLEERVRLHFGM